MSRFSQIVIYAQGGALDLLSSATNLTVLDLGIPDDLTFIDLIRRLEPLKQLKQLWLVLDFDEARPPLSEYDNLPSTELPSLPSIRELFFNTRATSHTVFNSNHLTQIFSKLEMVTVYYLLLRCTKCKYVDVTKSRRITLNKCARQFTETWQQCATVKKIWAMPDFKETVMKKGKLCRYDELIDRCSVDLLNKPAVKYY